MSFPELPFDESLFEANELMRTYWERSTQDRDDHEYEGLKEERMLPEDFADLRAASKEAFLNRAGSTVVGAPARANIDAVVKPLSTEAPVAPVTEEPAAPEAAPEAAPAPAPRTLSGADTAWVILAVVAVFVILVFLLGRTNRYRV